MRCDECGYDYDDLDRADVALRIRAFGPRYAALLDRDQTVLRTKPGPDVWSPLEYGCHIRDVFRAQRERIALALEQDGPLFTSIHRDERAVEDRYNEQNPSVVRSEVTGAADDLASAFEAWTTRAGHAPACTPTRRRRSGRSNGSDSTRSTKASITCSTSSVS